MNDLKLNLLLDLTNDCGAPPIPNPTNPLSRIIQKKEGAIADNKP